MIETSSELTRFGHVKMSCTKPQMNSYQTCNRQQKRIMEQFPQWRAQAHSLLWPFIAPAEIAFALFSDCGPTPLTEGLVMFVH